MLVSEFIDRVGYQPTAEEYAEIEQAYYVFDGDKDAFCRAWSKANPHKAGKLWAAIKENERKSKVFDKLVRHIVSYARRKDFDPNMLYYMNYADRSSHADFVCRKIGAKDSVDLWRAMERLNDAHAVRSAWSTRTWDYYRILEEIVYYES